MSTTAILVCSCDKYRDLWDPFFVLLRRYWPDCPYPVYLLSNTVGHDGHGVNNLLIGDDRDWTSNLQAGLKQIPEEKVMIFMEDYFLTRPVQTETVKGLLAEMDQRAWGYLRLFPVPGAPASDRTVAGLPVGPLPPGAPYRVSLQLAVWTKDLLAHLLVTGESAWQLELIGSGRSGSLTQPFYSLTHAVLDQVPVPYFCTGVEKGRWVPGALKLLAREGIAVDRSRRGVQRPWHKAQRWVRHWGGRLLKTLGLRK